MLPGVTPVHKGLKPSGLSFIQRTFINLPFKAHTKAITNKGFSGMPSASLALSFVSYDRYVAPISLTGHSLDR